jgi:hypothetical protein
MQGGFITLLGGSVSQHGVQIMNTCHAGRLFMECLVKMLSDESELALCHQWLAKSVKIFSYPMFLGS